MQGSVAIRGCLLGGLVLHWVRRQAVRVRLNGYGQANHSRAFIGPVHGGRFKGRLQLIRVKDDGFAKWDQVLDEVDSGWNCFRNPLSVF